MQSYSIWCINLNYNMCRTVMANVATQVFFCLKLISQEKTCFWVTNSYIVILTVWLGNYRTHVLWSASHEQIVKIGIWKRRWIGYLYTCCVLVIVTCYSMNWNILWSILSNWAFCEFIDNKDMYSLIDMKKYGRSLKIIIIIC